jgi:hypothetical protein
MALVDVSSHIVFSSLVGYFIRLAAAHSGLNASLSFHAPTGIAPTCAE